MSLLYSPPPFFPPLTSLIPALRRGSAIGVEDDSILRLCCHRSFFPLVALGVPTWVVPICPPGCTWRPVVAGEYLALVALGVLARSVVILPLLHVASSHRCRSDSAALTLLVLLRSPRGPWLYSFPSFSTGETRKAVNGNCGTKVSKPLHDDGVMSLMFSATLSSTAALWRALSQSPPR